MFSMSHLILEPNFSQCCFSNVRGLFLKKIIVSIACCTANLKLVSLDKSQKFFPPNFQRRNNQGPGGGRGVPGALEPWSLGALKFLLWSPEPYHFTDLSPDPFWALDPRAQRHFARSVEPSVFKFDHSSFQIALILDYCLFVFVCVC